MIRSHMETALRVAEVELWETYNTVELDVSFDILKDVRFKRLTNEDLVLLLYNQDLRNQFEKEVFKAIDDNSVQIRKLLCENRNRTKNNYMRKVVVEPTWFKIRLSFGNESIETMKDKVERLQFFLD